MHTFLCRQLKKGAHFSFQDRNTIQNGITSGLAKSAIALSLNADPTSVAKEIQKHRAVKKYGGDYPIQCALYQKCKERNGVHCNTKCHKFIRFSCKRRDRSPGACNGCADRCRCHFEKLCHNAERADAEYREMLVDSQEGIDMTTEEALTIGTVIKQLIDQGQSPHEIIANHPEFGFTERTLYSYIDQNVFPGDHNIDLWRKPGRVQHRMPREKKNAYRKRRDYTCLKGLTQADFETYIAQNSSASVVEMDTMYNDVSNGPFVQTFRLVDAQIAIAFYHEEKTADAMIDGVNRLEEMLGSQLFGQSSRSFIQTAVLNLKTGRL